MAIALVDHHGRSYAYLAAALADAGLSTIEVTEIGVAASCDVALVLVGPEPIQAMRFISELRARHPMTPQLAIVDRDDVALRLAAYEAGADDCLSRPFHLRELAAKLTALRRRGLRDSPMVKLADSEAILDLIALEMRAEGRTRSLTKREADLLAMLARADGRAVRREDVIRDAWGADPGLTANLVDVYVGYARRKLQDLKVEVSIKSIRGEGFRMVGRRSTN